MGYFLFFLAGLGFGYAASGALKWVPVAFPLLLGLAAIASDGMQGEILVRLIVALIITGGGILLGIVLDQRSQSSGEAAEAR
jgi:hypothetical protein